MFDEKPFLKQLRALAHPDYRDIIRGGQIGIEKESLRIDAHGHLSQSPHPQALGSPLTHPYITTDYSEMLLELVTPPRARSGDSLNFLEDLHRFVYHHLGNDEMLWPCSLPCPSDSTTRIPLAQYGCSNMGQMKTIYRRGLGYRYGRAMQTISGVHFNYSFDERLWACLPGAPETLPPDERRNKALFATIRNLMRLSWVIPYLFGASPATCRHFPHETSPEHALETFDASTLYGPYATSLRMGDLGYQNNLLAKNRLFPDYNTLRGYLAALHHAVTTSSPDYEKFGVCVNGVYRQLNTNLLQIENELYATVRPKCLQEKNEMRLHALYQRGVEYIELRSLDLNPFSPIGLDIKQMHFLEVLFWFSLLHPSPPFSTDEQKQIHHNEVLTAHHGRNPELFLNIKGTRQRLADLGEELCSWLLETATWLDTMHAGNDYEAAVAHHRALFADPDATLSQRCLDEMRTQQLGFSAWAYSKAAALSQSFATQALPPQRLVEWDALTQQSLLEQHEQEAHETLTLEDFMHAYFSQLDHLRL